MKIHVLSDLHAEFAPVDLPETDADVIVLAGDVHGGTRGVELARELAGDRPVVYVAGNHEHLGRSLPAHLDALYAAAEGSHVHFLENREVVLHGVRFLGCTLWSGQLLFGPVMQPLAERTARDFMIDYKQIQGADGGTLLTPAETRGFHAKSRIWLERRLADPRWKGPTVVVTHHAPSLRSVPSHFQNSLTSASFASEMSEMVADSGAVLWIHGHVHHPCDYTLGDTRVLSNPRGYAHEHLQGFDPALVVDVEV
jgi:predicted phosphodiesterase